MPDHFHAESLIWGHGPRLFEVFLEPTCPFSVKALNKLDSFLEQAGEDTVRVQIWLHSQPWHLYSAVIIRTILAASTLKDGKTSARKVMVAVADHREEFVFEDHCSGPNRRATPDDIIKRLEDYSGLILAPAFDIASLDQLTIRHTKYARQNGIHSSPTFMVDGLVDPSISSGDEVSQWLKRFR